MSKFHPDLAQIIFCYFVIAFSIWTFVSSGLVRSLSVMNSDSTEADFYVFYSAGKLWNDGQDPYNFELFRSSYIQVTEAKKIRGNVEYYYPPQASMLFGLLAGLSVRTAYLGMLGLNLLLLVLSLFMLAHILSWFRPIRLPELTLLISFTATGFGRMNVREGQLGLIFCVLILGTFIFARSKRHIFAGVALGAVTLKPTFLLLYAGYYLLHRSYRLVIIGGLAGVLLTALPVLLTQRPLYGTIQAWLHALGRRYTIINIDDPSPFTPSSALLSNLEPLVYRVFNVRSPLTSAIAYLIVLVLVILVAYLIWCSKKSGREELLDFGLVSSLSLLAIYHRPYDSFLLLPGILYLYLYFTEARDEAAKRSWGLFIAGIMFLLILPIDLSVRIAARYPFLLSSYVWRLISPIQAWAGLAVFVALLRLRIQQLFVHKQLFQL